MALYVADSCNGIMTLLACDDNGSGNPDMPYITATGILPGTPVYINKYGQMAVRLMLVHLVFVPLFHHYNQQHSHSPVQEIPYLHAVEETRFTLEAIIPDIHGSTDRYAINPLSSTSGGCFNPYIFPGGGRGYLQIFQ